MKQKKDAKAQNRLQQDVNETSRTLKPGRSVKHSDTTSHNSTNPPTANGGITNIGKGDNS